MSFVCTLSAVDQWVDEDAYCEPVQVMVVRIDDKCWKFVENPSDGYRSYAEAPERLENYSPKNAFPGYPVLLSFEQDDDPNFEGWEARTLDGSHSIFRVGTDESHDWYPCFVANYSPPEDLGAVIEHVEGG